MRCPLCGSDIDGNTCVTCPECGAAISGSIRLFSAIALVEDAVISFMLLSMILLVLVQIVLRNFYAAGISGGAEMVRHLLLWVAFLGAAIAAREGKHIKIDIAQRILPPRPKNFVEILTGLFTTIVCALLLYASIRFIRADYGLGTTIPFFNLRIWILELVIPLGYGAVTLRYALRSTQAFLKLVKGM
ncbi:MAG TPA: TRAP transporter small permease subunit [Desulfomonilia bacterium]|nr:TRAP transporter small permease subunit [Desulfomonilia bacterium]